MANKNKFQSRKVRTKEIVRFRGVIDEDSNHNAPDAYVSDTTNLPSVKIRQMDSRAGQTIDSEYQSGINTGSLSIISRVIGEGSNLHAEAIIPLPNRSLPDYEPPTIPDPPPIDPPDPTPEHDYHPAEWCRFYCSYLFGSMFADNATGAAAKVGSPMEYNSTSKVWSVGNTPLSSPNTAMDQIEFWSEIQTRASEFGYFIKISEATDLSTGRTDWSTAFYSSEKDMFEQAGGSVFDSDTVYGFRRYVGGVYVGRGIMQAGDDFGDWLNQDVLRVLTTHKRVCVDDASFTTMAEEGVSVASSDNIFLDTYLVKSEAYVAGSESSKNVSSAGEISSVVLPDSLYTYTDDDAYWPTFDFVRVVNRDTGLEYQITDHGLNWFSITAEGGTDPFTPALDSYRIYEDDGTNRSGYLEGFNEDAGHFRYAKYVLPAPVVFGEYRDGYAENGGSPSTWIKVSYNTTTYFQTSESSQMFFAGDDYSLRPPYTTYASIPAPEFGSNVSIASTVFDKPFATGTTVHKIASYITSKAFDFPLNLSAMIDLKREFTMGIVSTVDIPMPPVWFIG